MKKYYLEDVDNVIKELKTNLDGLSSKEASERLENNGKNKLREAKKKSLIKKILESLSNPMIIMLLVTSIISAIVAFIEHDSYADVLIILFVVAINTAMGIIQENKSEEAINSLKEMTASTTKVKRDGKLIKINSEDLVVGDIVVLEDGDIVPADARIIKTTMMKVDESQLTGESLSINKSIETLNLAKNQLDIPLADRKNMIYSGSIISYGRGEAVIVATGMDTEIGKIASSLEQAKDEQTPLQKKMSDLSKTLTKAVIAICIIVFILGLVKAKRFNTDIILDTSLAAIALAVAAIPEGLPAVVTVILSIGVISMSKRKALIRKLTAVETLGCVQVICTDKTGTLTKNKMTVIKTFTANEDFKPDNDLLAMGMALCSDSIIEKGEKYAKGEPTENGLVEYANKLGFPKYELDEEFTRIGTIPFDSSRKMMTTIHELNNEEYNYIRFTKGAAEILIEHCTYYLENGKVHEMNEEFKNKVLNKNAEFANQALRVLGLAYRKFNEPIKDYESCKVEEDLVFVGLVGMMDPVREEVFSAIKKCKNAGIRPIMITGDQRDTAVAIAKQLDIVKDSSEATIGAEIDGITDDELIEVVKKCSVFARVQPEHKTRIVKALKSQNYVTAMTGDGVNDAPSIKAADVGISMGITGTDVAKQASDVVLADDNFATIVNAVEEGRKIYDNVRKVIQFQLSTNMGEVLAIFFASLMNIEILTPAHLLWVNMITDTTPGLSLGMEKGEENLMKRKPRNSNESVFSNGAGFDMIWQGIAMTILIFISFFIGQRIETGRCGLFNSTLGMSMAFLTTNFVEMFEAICMRSQTKSIFKLKSFNWWLFGSAILTIILTLLVVCIPFFINIFGFATMGIKEIAIAFGISLLLVPIIEIVKAIKRKR